MVSDVIIKLLATSSSPLQSFGHFKREKIKTTPTGERWLPSVSGSKQQQQLTHTHTRGANMNYHGYSFSNKSLSAHLSSSSLSS